ncbi:MAG: hypothetical protein ACD_43C00058G0002 [uncultured bacterium]|nr:MAG: hypothetical protein ACD_43C00058G0002 [uncultured bacterium]
MMKARKTNQGFTLIELLIVIAIIGLLATLAIVSLSTAQQKARDAKRIADLKQIQNAVELYNSEHNGAYPIASAAANNIWAGTAAPAFAFALNPYLTNMPQDPTNDGTYYYAYGSTSTGTAYFVGATLEADNSALDGDDDTAWTAAGGSPTMVGLDTVLSTDTVAASVDSYTCVDSAAPYRYCVTN